MRRILKIESGGLMKRGGNKDAEQSGAVSIRVGNGPDPNEVKINDTLFEAGGILLIVGPSGSGKAELAEYVAVHATNKHNMLPLFGTMGERPNEKLRPISELLKSSLLALRTLDKSLPADDREALKRLLPNDFHAAIDWLGPCLGYGDAETQKKLHRDESENKELYLSRRNEARRAVISLVRRLVSVKKVLVMMPLIRGSNLYHMDTSLFWEISKDLSAIANSTRENDGQCCVLLLVVRNIDNDNAQAVKIREEAKRIGCYCDAVPLEQDCVREYCALHLKVDVKEIPPPLMEFVASLARGNATFISETLDQLIDNGNLEVRRKDGSNEVVYTSELEAINITKWHETAMVGGAICLLESLDPLQAAVVKMATVFTGPFTISDLAASSCSRWAGATRFDTLLLFKSMDNLVKCNIIDLYTNPKSETPEDRSRDHNKQYFALTNFLIRKVGGSMVLEAQKKAIKRQALIERVLQKDLPSRMAELARKKAIPHIPWYYQIEVPNKRQSQRLSG